MTPARRSPFLLVLCLVVLVSCGTLRSPAAVVNGRTIDDREVARTVRLLGFLADFGGRSCGQAFPGESERSACARLALSTLLQEQPILAYAREHGIEVADERVESALADARSSVGEEAFADLLAGRSLTEDEVRDLVRRLLLPGLVQDALAPELVTVAELRGAYTVRSLEFTTFDLAHILVATRREAVLILESGLSSTNFARNARHFSTDRRTAGEGGELGRRPALDLPQPIADALRILEPGQVAGPVRTEAGWHLLLLHSRRVAPLERVRDQLLDGLAPDAFQRWFRRQLDAAEIEVNPRYGRFDVSVGEVLPIRSTATFAPPSPSAVPP